MIKFEVNAMIKMMMRRKLSYFMSNQDESDSRSHDHGGGSDESDILGS